MVLAGAIGLAIIVSFLIDRKMWLGKENEESTFEDTTALPHKTILPNNEDMMAAKSNFPISPTPETAIRAVPAGKEIIVEPEKPVDKVSALTQGKELTRREREIPELLLEGRSVPVICERLVISEGTARTHVKHIYQKLGVHNRQELLDLAEQC
jgi:DNA-binding CsgD family transcriptional regulator